MICKRCGCETNNNYDGGHYPGQCLPALKEKVKLLEAQNKDTEKTFDDLMDYGWNLLYPGKKDWDYPGQVINHLYAEIQSQERKADRYEDALQLISNWQQAYPLEVFPEPDLKKARVLLEAGGITLDSLSAHAMRHVINGVKDIVNDALYPKIVVMFPKEKE